MSENVLLAGLSTRAAAESAARAGFQVTSIDAFADLDQHPSVRALSVLRDFGRKFSPAAVTHAARGVTCDVVAYLSSFENHPRAVASLAAGRGLWGNPVDVLAMVRDPVRIAQAFARRGFLVPAVRVDSAARARGREAGGGSDTTGSRATGRRWLVKPLASGGGQRVRPWRVDTIPRRSYLQELVPGVSCSVVFVAAGGCAAVLGISRQLVGDAAFGARGYRYCGSILLGESELAEASVGRLASRAATLASAAAEAFGLVGVNGVDFIAHGTEPVPIEVNPRWCASMELVERAHGLSVFGAHARACASARLPAVDVIAAARGAAAVGKAIVFARADAIVGDTRPWLDDVTVRDVPAPGERISAGQPVCTVFAGGRTQDECYRALVARADRVYAQVTGWTQAVA